MQIIPDNSSDLDVIDFYWNIVSGVGDRQASQLKGIARYGELTVETDGTTAVVSYPAEEQLYYILDGEGTLLYEDQKAPVKKDDFMYLPINVKHGMANTSNRPVRLLGVRAEFTR